MRIFLSSVRTDSSVIPVFWTLWLLSDVGFKATEKSLIYVIRRLHAMDSPDASLERHSLTCMAAHPLTTYFIVCLYNLPRRSWCCRPPCRDSHKPSTWPAAGGSCLPPCSNPSRRCLSTNQSPRSLSSSSCPPWSRRKTVKLHKKNSNVRRQDYFGAVSMIKVAVTCALYMPPKWTAAWFHVELKKPVTLVNTKTFFKDQGNSWRWTNKGMRPTFSHSSLVQNRYCYCSERISFEIQQDCIIKEYLKPFNWLLVVKVVKIAVLVMKKGKQTLTLGSPSNFVPLCL